MPNLRDVTVQDGEGPMNNDELTLRRAGGMLDCKTGPAFSSVAGSNQSTGLIFETLLTLILLRVGWTWLAGPASQTKKPVPLTRRALLRVQSKLSIW